MHPLERVPERGSISLSQHVFADFDQTLGRYSNDERVECAVVD